MFNVSNNGGKYGPRWSTVRQQNDLLISSEEKDMMAEAIAKIRGLVSTLTLAKH